MNLKDCYKILAIAPGTPLGLVKRAYKNQIKIWHPDRFSGDPALQSLAEENTKKVNLAYAMIASDLQSQPPDFKRAKTGPSPKARAAVQKAEPTKGDSPPKKEPADDEKDINFWQSVRDFLETLRQNPAQMPPRPHRAGYTDMKRERRTPRRRKPFNKILEEAAVSPPSPRRSSRIRKSLSPWNRALRNRAKGRRRGGAIQGIGESRRVGPVRPVERIRGIGRNH
jgi:curved DNA-binding protein CbpA